MLSRVKRPASSVRAEFSRATPLVIGVRKAVLFMPGNVVERYPRAGGTDSGCSE